MNLRALPLLALCACSAHLLPLAAANDKPQQALQVTYEKSSWLFFKSQQTDGLLQRFQSAGPVVLATVVRPETGLFASSDEGAAWTFASMNEPPRQVLFDKADPLKLYARAGMRISYSADGGHTWKVSQPGAVEALALGPGGAVYAAGSGSFSISEDGARTWRTLPIDPTWHARGIAAHAGALFLAVHVDEGEEPASPATGGARGRVALEAPRDLLSRFVALLDYSSDEAVSALALADSRDDSPHTVAWDAARGDGVYRSLDGGATWKKTGLALDAAIASVDGALYAVAAAPILQAAALVRRYPDLAALAGRQMHADRADPAGLRAACRYPGRDALLAGPIATALIFRTSDGGATWARVHDPPLPLALALREAMERAQWEPSFYAPPQRQRPQQQRQRGPQRGSAYRGMENPQRTGVPTFLRGSRDAALGESLLSFVDPLRLLAHFNGGAPLSGVSGDVAWVATEARWTALADAMAEQSQEEGEMSLGPGAPRDNGVAYELLHWSGSGWQPLASELPTKNAAFPLSLAVTPHQFFVLLTSRDEKGQRWRAAFRVKR